MSRWLLFGKRALAAAGALGAGGAATVYLSTPAFATELHLHSAHLPWSHNGYFASLDAASVRRGYFVYKQVCAACHGLKFIAYRHLVGVCLTEEEAKAEAAEINVVDGPNEEGNMFERPGKLSDFFPNPYKNVEEAKAANNGAAPPDLSFVVAARHQGADYLFHLLTGYVDPPAGRTVADGQYYNPYFPGGAISMAQSLYNEVIEYDDGTPATASQLAKDVATFLTWTAEMEHDDRKRMALRVMPWLLVLSGVGWYSKRLVFTYLKSRKVAYKDRPPRKFYN